MEYEHSAASRASALASMNTYVVYSLRAFTIKSPGSDVFAAMVDNCLGVESRGPMRVVGRLRQRHGIAASCGFKRKKKEEQRTAEFLNLAARMGIWWVLSGGYKMGK